MEKNIDFNLNKGNDMNYEVSPIEANAEGAGLSKLAIGCIIAAGAIVIGTVAWVGNKLLGKHEDNTELRKPDEDKPIEPTQEQIDEVTAK